MPEGEKIGSAYVEVQADISAADSALQALLDKMIELEKRAANLQVGNKDADLSKPPRGRDTSGRDIAQRTGQGPPPSGESSGGRTTVDVHVDTGKVAKQIQDALNGQTFDIKVRISNIEELQSQLDGITVNVDVNGGGGGGASTNTVAQEVTKVIDADVRNAARGVLKSVSETVGGGVEDAISQIQAVVQAAGKGHVPFRGDTRGFESHVQSVRAQSESDFGRFMVDVSETLGISGKNTNAAAASIRSQVQGGGLPANVQEKLLEVMGMQGRHAGPIARFASTVQPQVISGQNVDARATRVVGTDNTLNRTPASGSAGQVSMHKYDHMVKAEQQRAEQLGEATALAGGTHPQSTVTPVRPIGIDSIALNRERTRERASTGRAREAAAERRAKAEGQTGDIARVQPEPPQVIGAADQPPSPMNTGDPTAGGHLATVRPFNQRHQMGLQIWDPGIGSEGGQRYIPYEQDARSDPSLGLGFGPDTTRGHASPNRMHRIKSLTPTEAGTEMSETEILARSQLYDQLVREELEGEGVDLESTAGQERYQERRSKFMRAKEIRKRSYARGGGTDYVEGEGPVDTAPAGSGQQGNEFLFGFSGERLIKGDAGTPTIGALQEQIIKGDFEGYGLLPNGQLVAPEDMPKHQNYTEIGDKEYHPGDPILQAGQTMSMAVEGSDAPVQVTAINGQEVLRRRLRDEYGAENVDPALSRLLGPRPGTSGEAGMTPHAAEAGETWGELSRAFEARREARASNPDLHRGRGEQYGHGAIGSGSVQSMEQAARDRAEQGELMYEDVFGMMSPEGQFHQLDREKDAEMADAMEAAGFERMTLSAERPEGEDVRPIYERIPQGERAGDAGPAVYVDNEGAKYINSSTGRITSGAQVTDIASEPSELEKQRIGTSGSEWRIAGWTGPQQGPRDTGRDEPALRERELQHGIRNRTARFRDQRPWWFDEETGKAKVDDEGNPLFFDESTGMPVPDLPPAEQLTDLQLRRASGARLDAQQTFGINGPAENEVWNTTVKWFESLKEGTLPTHATQNVGRFTKGMPLSQGPAGPGQFIDPVQGAMEYMFQEEMSKDGGVFSSLGIENPPQSLGQLMTTLGNSGRASRDEFLPALQAALGEIRYRRDFVIDPAMRQGVGADKKATSTKPGNIFGDRSDVKETRGQTLHAVEPYKGQADIEEALASQVQLEDEAAQAQATYDAAATGRGENVARVRGQAQRAAKKRLRGRENTVLKRHGLSRGAWQKGYRSGYGPKIDPATGNPIVYGNSDMIPSGSSVGDIVPHKQVSAITDEEKAAVQADLDSLDSLDTVTDQVLTSEKGQALMRSARSKDAAATRRRKGEVAGLPAEIASKQATAAYEGSRADRAGEVKEAAFTVADKLMAGPQAGGEGFGRGGVLSPEELMAYAQETDAIEGDEAFRAEVGEALGRQVDKGDGSQPKSLVEAFGMHDKHAIETQGRKAGQPRAQYVELKPGEEGYDPEDPMAKVARPIEQPHSMRKPARRIGVDPETGRKVVQEGPVFFDSSSSGKSGKSLVSTGDEDVAKIAEKEGRRQFDVEQAAADQAEGKYDLSSILGKGGGGGVVPVFVTNWPAGGAGGAGGGGKKPPTKEGASPDEQDDAEDRSENLSNLGSGLQALAKKRESELVAQQAARSEELTRQRDAEENPAYSRDLEGGGGPGQPESRAGAEMRAKAEDEDLKTARAENRQWTRNEKAAEAQATKEEKQRADLAARSMEPDASEIETMQRAITGDDETTAEELMLSPSYAGAKRAARATGSLTRAKDAAKAAEEAAAAAGAAPTPAAPTDAELKAVRDEENRITAARATRSEREMEASKEDKRLAGIQADTEKAENAPIRPTSKAALRNRMINEGIPTANRPKGPFGFPGREFTPEAYESQGDTKQVMANVRGEVRQARGRMPQRALGTSMIQLAQNTIGNADEVSARLASVEQGYATLGKMERDRNRLAGEVREGEKDTAVREEAIYESRNERYIAKAQMIQANLTGDKAAGAEAGLKFAKLSETIRNDEAALTEHKKKVDENKNSVKELDKNMGSFGKKLEAQAKAAVGVKDIARNLGAGFVGGIAGGLTTMAVSTAVQGVIAGITNVGIPALDKALGSGLIAQERQIGLAGAYGQSGFRDSAMTSQYISAGLGPEAIARMGETVSPNAVAIAQAEQLNEQMDWLKTENAVMRQQADSGYAVPPAMGQSAGAMLSIGTPFGFGIDIGGKDSPAKMLGGIVDLLAETDEQGRKINKMPDWQLQRHRDAIAGFQSIPGTTEAEARKMWETDTFGIDSGAALSPQQRRYVYGEQTASELMEESELPGRLEEVLNGALQDVGSEWRLEKGETDDKLISVLEKMGGQFEGDLAPALERAGVTIRDQEGNELTPADFEDFFADLAGQMSFQAKGNEVLDSAAFNNQVWRMQEQHTLQREQLRLSQGMSVMGQPEQAFGTGIAYLPGTGATPGMEGSDRATELDTAIGAGVEQVKKDLMETYGVSEALVDEFADLGEETKKWSEQVGAIKAAQNVEAFQISLTKASQSMADLRGLMGKQGGSNIGVLQRENVMLQRRSQLLSMEMQQRKLNFGVAMAGFQSIGLTGEERAANIRIAKKEAAIGQEQLDIGKQQFGNNVELFNAQNMRSFKNLARDINKMISDFNDNNRIAEYSQLAAKAKRRQDQVSQQIQQILSQEMQLLNLQNEIAGKIADDTNKRLKLAPRYERFAKHMRTVVDDLDAAIKKADKALEKAEAAAEERRKQQRSDDFDEMNGVDDGNDTSGINITVNVAGHAVPVKEIAKVIERELGDQGALLGLNS